MHASSHRSLGHVAAKRFHGSIWRSGAPVRRQPHGGHRQLRRHVSFVLPRLSTSDCPSCTLNHRSILSSGATIQQPWHSGHRQPRRHLAFVLPRLSNADCPFRTLNIPQDAKYADAKKSFLKIAMKHHPDTLGNQSEEERQKSQRIFLRCRAAYESLVRCEATGKCLVGSKVEKVKKMSDEDFDEWFEKETGLKNTFELQLDPEVMREVAPMHDDAALKGTDGGRDGGM